MHNIIQGRHIPTYHEILREIVICRYLCILGKKSFISQKSQGVGHIARFPKSRYQYNTNNLYTGKNEHRRVRRNMTMWVNYAEWRVRKRRMILHETFVMSIPHSSSAIPHSSNWITVGTRRTKRINNFKSRVSRPKLENTPQPGHSRQRTLSCKYPEHETCGSVKTYHLFRAVSDSSCMIHYTE